MTAKKRADARSKYKRDRNGAFTHGTRCVGPSVSASSLDQKLKHHRLFALCDGPTSLILREEVTTATDERPAGLHYLDEHGAVVSHVDDGVVDDSVAPTVGADGRGNTGNGGSTAVIGEKTHPPSSNHSSEGSPHTPTSPNGGANGAGRGTSVRVGPRTIVKALSAVYEQIESLHEENVTLRTQCSSLQAKLEQALEALGEKDELLEKYEASQRDNEALRDKNEELYERLRKISEKFKDVANDARSRVGTQVESVRESVRVYLENALDDNVKCGNKL